MKPAACHVGKPSIPFFLSPEFSVSFLYSHQWNSPFVLLVSRVFGIPFSCHLNSVSLSCTTINETHRLSCWKAEYSLFLSPEFSISFLNYHQWNPPLVLLVTRVFPFPVTWVQYPVPVLPSMKPASCHVGKPVFLFPVTWVPYPFSVHSPMNPPLVLLVSWVFPFPVTWVLYPFFVILFIETCLLSCRKAEYSLFLSPEFPFLFPLPINESYFLFCHLGPMFTLLLSCYTGMIFPLSNFLFLSTVVPIHSVKSVF